MPKMWKQEHIMRVRIADVAKLTMAIGQLVGNILLGKRFVYNQPLFLSNRFSYQTAVLNRWADREKLTLISFDFLQFYYSVI